MRRLWAAWHVRFWRRVFGACWRGYLGARQLRDAEAASEFWADCGHAEAMRDRWAARVRELAQSVAWVVEVAPDGSSSWEVS